MIQLIHFPADPADPVALTEVEGPDDLSAFFCDQFDAVHGRGWTAYLLTDPPSVYFSDTLDHNARAAAFLDSHAAQGRADWHTFLRGPVLVACRPVLTADPLPPELTQHLTEPEDLDLLQAASART